MNERNEMSADKILRDALVGLQSGTGKLTVREVLDLIAEHRDQRDTERDEP